MIFDAQNQHSFLIPGVHTYVADAMSQHPKFILSIQEYPGAKL